MKIGVRLGVFRDSTVLGGVLPDEAPIVVPAHIAAYALDGLRGFLGEIARARRKEWVDYVFDPMTYWVDLPSRYWSRGSERRQGQDLRLPFSADADTRQLIRPTLLALLREYGLATALFETDLPGMRARLLEAVPACIGFQRNGTRTRQSRARGKYARILELAADEEAILPMAVVTPYVKLRGLREADVADQVVLNTRSLEVRDPGESMWTVLALEGSATIGALPATTASSLGIPSFDAVGVWISDFDEYVEPTERLKGLRRLLQSLNRPAWIMYGTYFSLLLGRDGVDLVSHGIYYTESKKMEGPVGSGPPPERYYVPALHRFYEPSSALTLIDAVPEFACSCSECPSTAALRAEAAAAGSSPSRRMAWAQRLQRHFLLARQRELELVATMGLGDLLEQLAEAERRFEAADVNLRTATGMSVGHLATWRQALGD